MSEAIVITGEGIAAYRLLAIRRGLKLYLETGIKPSRNFSLRVVNSVLETPARTYASAYPLIDALVVSELGMPSVPLGEKR